MKNSLSISLALLAGFAGGLLGSRVTLGSKDSPVAHVVRARSFELVDEAGKAISIWGRNKQGHTLLAFIGSEAIPGESQEHSIGLDDPLVQRAAIGVQGIVPVLTFRGTDGKARVMLYLHDWQKPLLMMEDETGPRVALGINSWDTPTAKEDDDNWALSFLPDRAWIGLSSRKEARGRYVRGFLSIEKDGVKYP